MLFSHRRKIRLVLPSKSHIHWFKRLHTSLNFYTFIVYSTNCLSVLSFTLLISTDVTKLKKKIRIRYFSRKRIQWLFEYHTSLIVYSFYEFKRSRLNVVSCSWQLTWLFQKVLLVVISSRRRFQRLLMLLCSLASCNLQVFRRSE